MGDDKERDDKEPRRRQRPGAVQHDARGNAVWQWAAESGRHAIDSTSRLLKKLEIPGLSLEDDKPKSTDAPGDSAHPDAGQHPGGPAARVRPPDPELGYDPYGGLNEAGRRPAPPAAKPASKPIATPAVKTPAAPGAGPVKKPAEEPHSRPSLWQRLFRKD